MGRRVVGARLSDKDFVLTDVILAYEAKFIREALEAEGGSVSHAARRLGVRHQTLAQILKTRQQGLLSLRTPAKSRRRSIIRHRSTSKQRTVEKQARKVTILYAEDDRMAANAVRGTLKLEGWKVVACADGETALDKLMSKDPYDVLLLAYDLPYFNGLEVVRRARRLPHREHTPTIILAAAGIEQDARRVGADVFLKKPQDAVLIAETIARLLALHPRR